MSSPGNPEELNTQLSNLTLNKNNDINILLLGSTGVGKSTFINSIANYLTFADLKTAEKEAPVVLIPSQFTVKDKHYKLQQVSIGKNDNNESLNTGESATQDVKTYVFPIWDGQTNVRIIDTPGIGDTRGIEKDDENSENILSYIASLHELHAICFLLKPNESRSTVYFKYCMSQILSRLEKSASKNILFVFTNTRGTDYGPGETMSILRKAIDEIQSKPPHCEIPLNRNVFCLENEAFKYLHAVKEKIEFENSYAKTMSVSWKKSTEECWKLIKYIVGDATQPPLKPHFVKNTSAVNEARRMITHLSQPLADISQLINQNMAALDRHKQNLDVDRNSIDDLRKKLYMPVVNLELTTLTQPVTVCTSKDCADIYKVGDKNNWHYKQRCHDPCYLRNVPKEIIGCPELVNCASMSNRQCIKCGCQFSVHMHVYYLTKVREDREIDSNVQKNISTKEKVIQNAMMLLRSMENKKRELESEHQTVLTCCAKFAHFLQNNAITPYNDAYAEYIKYLIDREKSLGHLCDMGTVHYLHKLLSQYEEMKKSFDDALKLNIKLKRTEGVVTAKEVQETIQTLYALKHNGKKIRELYECQLKSRCKEHSNSEYIHKLRFVKQEASKDRESHERKKNTKPTNRDQRSSNNRTTQRRSNSPPTYDESQLYGSRASNSNTQRYDNNPRRGYDYPQRGHNYPHENPSRGYYSSYGSENQQPGYYPYPRNDDSYPPRNNYPTPRNEYPPRDYYAPSTGSYPPARDEQPPRDSRHPRDGQSDANLKPFISISVNPSTPSRHQDHTPPATSYGSQPPFFDSYGQPRFFDGYSQPPHNYNTHGSWPVPPVPHNGHPEGYPPSRDSYNFHHGVNRNQNSQGYQPRYNDRANRQRGFRGRGGINKNHRPRKNGNRSNNAGSDDGSDDSRDSYRN